MNTVGINLDRLRDGVCGSPIVIDSYDLDPEDQGDVLGIFAYTLRSKCRRKCPRCGTRLVNR
jgi:hypothetical protein